MIAKLKKMPTYNAIHSSKDELHLLKTIKALTFMSTSSKEYEMSLVEADDKFRRIFQSKDMTNI
jgi:hypothetical protein